MFLCSLVLLDLSTSQELEMERTRIFVRIRAPKKNLNLKFFNNTGKAMAKTSKCTLTSVNSAH
jgi:hypothetical protein